MCLTRLNVSLEADRTVNQEIGGSWLSACKPVEGGEYHGGRGHCSVRHLGGWPWGKNEIQALEAKIDLQRRKDVSQAVP